MTLDQQQREESQIGCGRKIGPYNCCTVVCGDCLELMKKLPDGCVDLAWFDPPYNVGKDYGDTCSDSLPDSEYLLRSELWSREARRAARSIAIYAPHKYLLHYWKTIGDAARQIILSYSPEGAIRYGMVNQFSVILTDARAIKYEKNVWHNCQMPGLGWFFREETYGHPGYTSEEITSRFISSFTHEGETVLDIFGGTGTTGAAAVKLGRHFLLIEISEDYCRIARERIALVEAQPTLFEPKPEQLSLVDTDET